MPIERDPAENLPEGRPAALVRQTSDRKLAANRANAQKSTGPRTAEGKQRVRLNGLKRRSVRLLDWLRPGRCVRNPGPPRSSTRN